MSAGGSAGSGGGGKAAVVPSAGCGKASPQTGSANSPLNVSNHQYYVKIPAAYDAEKPYLVLFVFNPTNNPLNWAETSAGFESNGAKDAAIRVYPGPANSSNGWGAGDVAFFRPLYDQVIANFCVDKARVFAAGESSGGDFSSILGCEHAEVLRGVAPCATKNVNGYPLDANARDCTGQVESIVIHGKNDNVVGPENGPKTRDFYAALNHCEATPTPVPVPNFSDAMSNCVEYQGCDPGYPVFWCQHTDPEYSGTNHGWPKFAAKFVWEQFSKL
jgi:poly(3-hydroxybutyrate) depolymerase